MSEDQQEAIKLMLRIGISVKEIAETVGCTTRTVKRYRKDVPKTNEFLVQKALTVSLGNSLNGARNRPASKTSTELVTRSIKGVDEHWRARVGEVLASAVTSIQQSQAMIDMMRKLLEDEGRMEEMQSYDAANIIKALEYLTGIVESNSRTVTRLAALEPQSVDLTQPLNALSDEELERIIETETDRNER